MMGGRVGGGIMGSYGYGYNGSPYTTTLAQLHPQHKTTSQSILSSSEE
jgi:hypothetical protein